MKIIELAPPPKGSKTLKESIELYMGRRGYKVLWRMPQPVGQKTRLNLDGVESKECPCCKRMVKRHDALWRRARMSEGRLGKFVKMCRSCEDQEAGFECLECKRHCRRSAYRVTSRAETGREYRARICMSCEAKPETERFLTCKKCGTSVSRADSVKATYCRPCTRAMAKPKNRPKVCWTCKTVKDTSDFDLGVKGARLRHCKACVAAAKALTEKRCEYCKTVRPIDDFGVDSNAWHGRKVVCKPCSSRVQSVKAKAKRARLKAAQV